MQKNYLNKLLFPLLLLTLGLLQQNSLQAACNWKSRYPYLYGWDTCKGSNAPSSVNAYISFQSKLSPCFKYEWKVNGNYAGSSNVMNYRVSKNGTYQICVKVTDTCNRCDTVFCLSKTVSCFSNACNWKSRYPKLEAWDSCKNTNSNINGVMAFNYSGKGCFKYTWKVNGVKVGEGYKISYPIKQNGTYNLCVTVLDTCNKCDTTFCSTRNITCIQNTCKWYKRNTYFSVKDSCNNTLKSYTVNGYFAPGGSCYKYNWTINGDNVSNARYFSRSILKNGSYNVCLKVTDTCDRCDTTFCKTVNISCIPTSACNWKSRYPKLEAWDSCKGSKSNINGVMAFNYPGKSCFKYTWKVNGVKVGEGYKISYPVKQNGSYNLCVTVLDTCNKCDTTFCSTRNITCIQNACNWKSRYPRVETWDSCKKSGSNVNALIAFNYSGKSCFKYTWKVNGVMFKTSNKNTLNYPIYQNGKYEICVKVTDTCNKCDTVFCMVKTVSCFKSCNWNRKIKAFGLGDSCKKGGAALMGYAVLDTAFKKTCFTYRWTVNGTVVSSSYKFGYNLQKNGTYKICLKLTDTCNKCDTSICVSRTVNCNFLGLNLPGNTAVFRVYPVPASETLQIETDLEATPVQIISTDGKAIWRGTLLQGENTVDVSGWAPGVYLLIESSGNRSKPVKIIIE